MTKVYWIKPSGVEVVTNDEKGNIEAAVNLGWKLKSEVEKEKESKATAKTPAKTTSKATAKTPAKTTEL
jgi:hypothetical protein